MRWVPYVSTPQSFSVQDLTRDGDWTMIANKDTSDRPAPQASGAEEDLLPAWTPTTPNARATYTVYNEWTLSQAGWIAQYGVDFLSQNLGAVHSFTLQVGGTVKDTFTITPNAAGTYLHNITPLLVFAGAVVRVTLQVTLVGNNQMYWEEQPGLFATPPTYCSLAQGAKDGAAATSTAYGCHLLLTPGTASPDWDIVAYGAGGAGGAAGAPGPAGKNAFTTTSGAFTVPAVGATTTVTVADPSWAATGQLAYFANAAGSGLAGALQITAVAGNQLTLLNPQPAPAIPPADNTQAGLLKILSGNATDYVGGDNACHSMAAISAFITKTSAYTLTTADSGKYVICSGGSWTLTLPAPVVGLNYRVRNDMGISGTTGTITIQPAGGTIDGLASIPLLPQQEATIISDGTNWRGFGKQRIVVLGTQDITSAQASAYILLPVGYRMFELEFTGLTSSINTAWLVGRVSQDGGNTFVTSGNYWLNQIFNSTTSAVGGGAANNATTWTLNQVVDSGNNPGQIAVKIFPGDAVKPATYIALGSGYGNAAGMIISSLCTGMFGTPGPVNAFQYLFNTGNIVRSYLTVKGVV
jgi:hypothetical protein